MISRRSRVIKRKWRRKLPCNTIAGTKRTSNTRAGFEKENSSENSRLCMKVRILSRENKIRGITTKPGLDIDLPEHVTAADEIPDTWKLQCRQVSGKEFWFLALDKPRRRSLSSEKSNASSAAGIRTPAREHPSSTEQSIPRMAMPRAPPPIKLWFKLN